MSAVSANWLVAYDVANKRRLVRVHRYLKAHGIAVQYSVFVVRADRRRLDGLLAGLAARIHPRQDDVRAYRLPARDWFQSLGRPTLPDGITAAVAGLIVE